MKRRKRFPELRLMKEIIKSSESRRPTVKGEESKKRKIDVRITKKLLQGTRTSFKALLGKPISELVRERMDHSCGKKSGRCIWKTEENTVKTEG